MFVFVLEVTLTAIGRMVSSKEVKVISCRKASDVVGAKLEVKAHNVEEMTYLVKKRAHAAGLRLQNIDSCEVFQEKLGGRRVPVVLDLPKEEEVDTRVYVEAMDNNDVLRDVVSRFNLPIRGSLMLEDLD